MYTAYPLFCLFCLIVAVNSSCLSSDGEIEYQNDIACPLEVECPKGYGINAVAAKAGLALDNDSNPINDTDDHQWFWNCSKISEEKAKNEYCYDFELGNDVRELVAFRCPESYYIGGLSTTTTNISDLPLEHMWTVRCCRREDLCISDCQLSDYLNEFGGDIEYCLPKDHFMVGIFSHVDSPNQSTNQRRWKVAFCQLSKCDFDYYANQALPHYGSYPHHGYKKYFNHW